MPALKRAKVVYAANVVSLSVRLVEALAAMFFAHVCIVVLLEALKGKLLNSEQAPARLWFWLLILFSTAVLLRLTYSLEMGKSFEFRRHEWRQTDMRFFRERARQIRDGDVLSRHIAVPRHSWLVRIQKREAWKKWLNHRFYQAPAYSYLLAFFLFLSSSLWPLFVFQMLLGVGTIGLTYAVGRRLFSWRVGLIASVAVLLYGPLLYLEPILLRSTVLTFFGLALLWLALWLRERSTFWRWGGAGLVLGVAVLFKPTFLLALPLMLGFAFYQQLPSPRLLFKYGVGGTLGLLLAVSPLLVRNLSVGAKPWAFSANAPLVFVQGNASDGKPFPNFRSRYFRKVFRKAEGKLWPTFRETLSEHSLTSFVSLHFKRMFSVLRKEEVPNNTCFALARKRSQTLAYLFVSFLWLIPFGLLGLLLCLRGGALERRAGWLLFGFLGVHALSWMWAGHLMRYRVPIAPILAIFSALSIHRALQWFELKQWKKLGTSAAFVVCLAGLLNLPSYARAVEVRHPDYLAPILHDMEASRMQDACEVASIAAQSRPKRYKPLQRLACRCQQQFARCGDENCLARVLSVCKKKFFGFVRRDFKLRRKRKVPDRRKRK